MAVTWRDVQATLGRTFTQPQQVQADAWIKQARILIGSRATQIGKTLDDLDQDTLDMVVTEAVAARAKRPDDATEVSIKVDDGETTRRYESSTGQIEITAAWWDLLFPRAAQNLFTITPVYEPDQHHRRPHLIVRDDRAW